jgi:hypothetical protein
VGGGERMGWVGGGGCEGRVGGGGGGGGEGEREREREREREGSCKHGTEPLHSI